MKRLRDHWPIHAAVGNTLVSSCNGAPVGGLKVIAVSGWFAVRPLGTEDIYKIYAESFRDEEHLQAIVTEVQQIVSRTLAGGA